MPLNSIDHQSSICLNESVTLYSNMTAPKKKSTRKYKKRKPRINEEQLEMARLYEKAWNELFKKIPKSIQENIIEDHDGRRAIAHGHEVAKLAEKWAYEKYNEKR